MPYDDKVLVLDTEDRATKFRVFMGDSRFEFLYAHSLNDAINMICEEKIPVVLVGSRINGHMAEEISRTILSKTNMAVHVILNLFESETCRFSTKSYVQTPMFDVIWPTTNPGKIEKRIIVALEAQKLEVQNSYVEGEETC